MQPLFQTLAILSNLIVVASAIALWAATIEGGFTVHGSSTLGLLAVTPVAILVTVMSLIRIAKQLRTLTQPPEVPNRKHH